MTETDDDNRGSELFGFGRILPTFRKRVFGNSNTVDMFVEKGNEV